MLQIEEWFRRPVRRTKVAAPSQKTEETPRTENKSGMEEKPGMANKPRAGEIPGTEDMFEPEPTQTRRSEFKHVEQTASAAVPPVELADTVAETEEMEQITEQIGLDVSDMIDMDQEDVLLRQIDEFREKAKQLQELMANRENKAKELQGVVDERSAKASELDSLIQVRQGEADKIMNSVSQKIDTMSADVRQNLNDVNQNLNGLEGTFQKEVSGLTQNISQEISQSTEKTRRMFEEAAKNLIDQNTRSLEGLKEQLEQLGQLDQIGELSTEMNTKITTLKTDIADKIHAEDVKCYRNIQASMDEQSKLLSEGDEKTRQHIQEQMESLTQRMGRQNKLGMVALVFSVLDFIGILGIIILMVLL